MTRYRSCYDSYEWPETKAFLARLGIDTDRDIQRVEICFDFNARSSSRERFLDEPVIVMVEEKPVATPVTKTGALIPDEDHSSVVRHALRGVAECRVVVWWPETVALLTRMGFDMKLPAQKITLTLGPDVIATTAVESICVDMNAEADRT